MSPIIYSRLLDFLKKDLHLPHNSIAMAERSVLDDTGMLPMALWQYGLVTLKELDRIYQWLETA